MLSRLIRRVSVRATGTAVRRASTGKGGTRPQSSRGRLRVLAATGLVTACGIGYYYRKDLLNLCQRNDAFKRWYEDLTVGPVRETQWLAKSKHPERFHTVIIYPFGGSLYIATGVWYEELQAVPNLTEDLKKAAYEGVVNGHDATGRYRSAGFWLMSLSEYNQYIIHNGHGYFYWPANGQYYQGSANITSWVTEQLNATENSALIRITNREVAIHDRQIAMLAVGVAGYVAYRYLRGRRK